MSLERKSDEQNVKPHGVAQGIGRRSRLCEESSKHLGNNDLSRKNRFVGGAGNDRN